MEKCKQLVKEIKEKIRKKKIQKIYQEEKKKLQSTGLPKKEPQHVVIWLNHPET